MQHECRITVLETIDKYRKEVDTWQFLMIPG